MGEASAVCNGSQDGKVVAVMTTDAEGKVVSLLLTYDTYDVAETRIRYNKLRKKKIRYNKLRKKKKT